MDTEWGAVKCAMGEAVSIGPQAFGKLPGSYVILAVPPVSPSNDDVDWDDEVEKGQGESTDSLHYLQMGLRSTIRGCFQTIKAKTANSVEAIGIPTITTKPSNSSEVYHTCLNIVLETIIEESKLTNLKAVYLLASSGEEAKTLIKSASELGLAIASS